MDTKRGDDAQDHAPQPKDIATDGASPDKEDASRTEQPNDGAIEVESINSVNDEGAN